MVGYSSAISEPDISFMVYWRILRNVQCWDVKDPCYIKQTCSPSAAIRVAVDAMIKADRSPRTNV